MSAISGGAAPVPVGRRVGSEKRYAAARQSRDRFVRFWRRLTQSRKTFAGLVILLIFLLIALFGPWIDSQSPSAMSSAVLQGPSTAHWLGTTQTGQDVAAQLLDGTRFTLLVSFGAAAVATVKTKPDAAIGMTWGRISEKRMRQLRSPATRAARTKSRRRRESVWARRIRAPQAHPVSARTRMSEIPPLFGR